MARMIISCVCGCGAQTTTDELFGWRRVDMANRGGRVAYVCPACAVTESGYDVENHATAGKSASEPWTYSVEFECDYPDEYTRAQFMHYQWLPTSDCTVGLEFKSPIFKSLNPVKGFMKTAEKLMRTGSFEVGDNCGTHIHIGHAYYINRRTIRIVAERYYRIFGPLSEYLAANPTECEQLFGRTLGYWADAISPRVYPYEHTNFVNIQHAETIEYRVCKFRTAAQYMHALKTCRALTDTVIQNYVKHALNGADADTLDHKADVTAQKLVRKFRAMLKAAPIW